MAQWRGFTVVELMVVMVIMAILLTLGVATFNGSQANVRDSERAADIGVIAKGLEARYIRGNPLVTATYITPNSYPSIYEIQNAEGLAAGSLPTNLGVYIDQILPGTTLANFSPPGTAAGITATFKPICPAAGTAPCNVNNNAEDSAKVTAAIGGSTGVYVYEPIDATNQICFNTACVRYNLYYLPEVTGATLQTITSKHQ